jgi:hypothetical protein
VVKKRMTQKPESGTLANYQMEYRKMRMGQEKTGFKIHLTVYIVVNTLLITLNLLTNPAFYWFVFPLIGWGIGITMHYINGVRRFEAQLKVEEAKIEHIINSR